MAFITHNANVMLLVLILISSVGLVGATIYFQDRFAEINTRFGEKKAELDGIQRNLTEKQQYLDRLVAQVALKESREQELTGKFVDRDTKLQQTTADLTSTKALKDKLEQERAQLQEQVLSLTAKKAELESTVRSLDADVNSWKSKYSSCQTDLSKCKNST